jgi:FHA domain
VTDVDGKYGGVDDEDATRPATPAPAVTGRTAPVDADAKPAEGGDSDDAPDVTGYGSPAELKRLAPQERGGDVVALAANEYLLGRSHTCNVPLLSSTASRQHARIVGRNGAWFLRPVGGKPVIVDGHPVYDEIALRHEMKIQLGGDEFVFVQEDPGSVEPGLEDETLVTPSAAASPPPAAVIGTGRSPVVWIVLGVGAVSLAALAFWLLL